MSLLLDWPHWSLGGDVIVQNCNLAQDEGASYSIGGSRGVEKGKLGTKLLGK